MEILNCKEYMKHQSWSISRNDKIISYAWGLTNQQLLKTVRFKQLSKFKFYVEAKLDMNNESQCWLCFFLTYFWLRFFFYIYNESITIEIDRTYIIIYKAFFKWLWHKMHIFWGTFSWNVNKLTSAPGHVCRLFTWA